ncbi:MAG: hypothetical protein ACK4YP_17130 [Myxococcota bacterium]
MILLLLACYTEAAFRDDADDAVCTWKSTCFDEDYPTCLAQAEAARAEVDPACTYDASEARACTAGLRDLVCPTDDAGAFDEDFGFPAACDAVWDCPG